MFVVEICAGSAVLGDGFVCPNSLLYLRLTLLPVWRLDNQLGTCDESSYIVKHHQQHFTAESHVKTPTQPRPLRLRYQLHARCLPIGSNPCCSKDGTGLALSLYA